MLSGGKTGHRGAAEAWKEADPAQLSETSRSQYRSATGLRVVLPHNPVKLTRAHEALLRRTIRRQHRTVAKAESGERRAERPALRHDLRQRRRIAWDLACQKLQMRHGLLANEH